MKSFAFYSAQTHLCMEIWF